MRPEQAPLQQSTEHKRKPGKKHKGRQRPVPQRTCVGCRAVYPKREMVRLVRTRDDTVAIDPSGKQPGRGAYLCQQQSCWEKALKHRSLERALKTTLDETAKAALVAFAETLPASLEV